MFEERQTTSTAALSLPLQSEQVTLRQANFRVRQTKRLLRIERIDVAPWYIRAFQAIKADPLHGFALLASSVWLFQVLQAAIGGQFASSPLTLIAVIWLVSTIHTLIDPVQAWCAYTSDTLRTMSKNSLPARALERFDVQTYARGGGQAFAVVVHVDEHVRLVAHGESGTILKKEAPRQHVVMDEFLHQEDASRVAQELSARAVLRVGEVASEIIDAAALEALKPAPRPMSRNSPTRIAKAVALACGVAMLAMASSVDGVISGLQLVLFALVIAVPLYFLRRVVVRRAVAREARRHNGVE